MGERQYGRDDVDYETWFTPWMKRLARNHTRPELEAKLAGAAKDGARASATHLRAVERSTSMAGQAQARAHARNSTALAGDHAIAIRGAMEIHDLFPEFATTEPEAEEEG